MKTGLRVPVVHLPRQEVAPLEQQDALARRRERVGQRAAAGAGADDDDVVVLGHRYLRFGGVVVAPVDPRGVRIDRGPAARATCRSSPTPS